MYTDKEKDHNTKVGLYKKVISGGFWVIALRVAEQLMQAVRLIILARILSPHDFGVFGLALLSLATLKTFSKTGFQTALIQKKGDIKEYLDVGWTISIIRGIILFFVLYFSAPFLATFFKSIESIAIIRCIAISVLIQSFVNIGIVYFQKEIEFKKQFIYQATGTFADFVVVIVTALILRNVWALVFGLLAKETVRLIASYVVCDYRPKISFFVKGTGELIHFAKWVVLSNILLFFIGQGDDIFVGKVLGVTALGFYQLAYRVSNMPITELTHVITQVSFPTYSKLQNNVEHLKRAYLKALRFATFVSFPMAGFIFVLANTGTLLLLGEKWLPMVGAIRVLCVFAIARTIGATSGPLFLGANKPKFLTYTTAIKFVLLAILIYPLTKSYGITGTALATTIPVFASQSYSISRVMSILNCKFKPILIQIIIPFMGTAIILLAYFMFRSYLPSQVYLLIATLFFGSGLYLFFIFLVTKFYKKYTIFSELKSVIGPIIEKLSFKNIEAESILETEKKYEE